MARERIYLDHAATTPVLPAARAAMAEALERWANPSSPHADGRAAHAALEDGRERIKRALGWTGELIFTSSATEAAALAFRRCWLEGPKPIISTVEHDAIRRQAPETERAAVGVGPDGLVDPEQLAFWLRLMPGGLVAVQHCNSETGVVQPIPDIIEAVDAAGSFLLVDCAQSAGKLPLPPADMIIVSAHKFGGPPGVGALLVRDLKLLVPQGGQERGYRGGTENLPAILGFAAALEADPVGLEAGYMKKQLANRLLLETRLADQGAMTVCDNSFRSPFVGSYYMPGMSAVAQLVRFDAMGISVSAGSACSSGTTKPSHVMEALKLDPAFCANVIRVSFGKDTSEADVMTFCEAWAELAAEARSRAA
jgi:cysteine desulfurase